MVECQAGNRSTGKEPTKARSDISSCVFREAAENLQQVGRQGGLVLPTWQLAQEFKEDYALWGGGRETCPIAGIMLITQVP